MGREIDTGPLAAAAGGVLVIVSLFLDWYGGFSAWTTFEGLDLLLAAFGVAAVAAAAGALGAPSWVSARALAPAGALAVLVVASQIVNHPPVGNDRDVEIGVWLALLGSLLLFAGGVVSIARISLAVRISERSHEPPPEPEPRPDAEPAPPPSEEETERL